MTRPRDIALYVAIGLVMTVAVAWGAAALAPDLSRRAATTWKGPARESPRPLAHFGILGRYDADAERVTVNGWLLRDEEVILLPRLELSSGFAGMPMVLDYDIYAAGWPLPALEWSDTEWRGIMDRSTATGAAWVREFGLNYDGQRHPQDGGWRSLPVRPWRWGLGLAVNTLVWSLAALGVIELSGTGRRRRRRRRGLCETCGYPRRDSSGRVLERCPECGAVARGAAASASEGA